MRVQAKRLKMKAGTPYYDFAYKPRLSKLRQIDRLVEAAAKDALPAVYALYNGPELDLGKGVPLELLYRAEVGTRLRCFTAFGRSSATPCEQCRHLARSGRIAEQAMVVRRPMSYAVTYCGGGPLATRRP